MDTCAYEKDESADIDVDINTDTDIKCSPDNDDDKAKLLHPTKPVKHPIDHTKKNDRHRGSCLKKCLCVTLVLIGLFLALVVIAGVFACRWLAGSVWEWDSAHGLFTVKMEGVDGGNENIFYDFQFLLNREEEMADDQHHGSRRTNWNIEILPGELFDWKTAQEYIEKHENIFEDLYRCGKNGKNDDGCDAANKVLEALEGISLEDVQVVFHGRDLNADDNSLSAVP